MKISVDKILFHTFSKVNKDYKSKSLQISLKWNPHWKLCLEADFIKSFGHIFIINLDILGLINLNWYKTEEEDHAGVTFTLNILGLDIEYCNKDVRHWDDENDCFEPWEIKTT